jgi:hypothetical protein
MILLVFEKLGGFNLTYIQNIAAILSTLVGLGSSLVGELDKPTQIGPLTIYVNITGSTFIGLMSGLLCVRFIIRCSDNFLLSIMLIKNNLQYEWSILPK